MYADCKVLFAATKSPNKLEVFTPSEILASLERICKFIDNNTLNSQQISSSQNLITSLIKLLQYDQSKSHQIENDNKTFETIISQCLECLNLIQRKGQEEFQIQLIENGYVKLLSMFFAMCGGKEIGNIQHKAKSLSNINNLFILFRDGRYQYELDENHLIYPPQPNLIKQSYEQLEEEGGVEEIDVMTKSNVLNKMWQLNRTISSIQNISRDLTNIERIRCQVC